MPTLSIIAAFAAAGAAAGFLAGLLGIGGGLILVPLLLQLYSLQGYSLDIALPFATGTSLAAVAIVTTLAAYRHRRRGALDIDVLRRFTPWVMLGAFVAPLVAPAIPARALAIVVGTLYGTIAVAILRDAMRVATTAPATGKPCLEAHWIVASAVATTVGSIAGIAGLAGSVLMTPLLSGPGGLPFKRALAASTGLAVPLTFAAIVSYALRVSPAPSEPLALQSIGTIHLPAAIGLALGGVLTVRLGAATADRIATGLLKALFALVVMLSAMRLILYR